MKSEKHIFITGHSNISWKDAIIKTIEEARQTINNLDSVEILNQKAKIVDDSITEYLVDLDLSFKIDPFIRKDLDDYSDLN